VIEWEQDIMSRDVIIGGIHLELGDNDWLMLRNTASADKTGETLAALRVLSEHGYLIPIPKPAVAVWKPDDDTRLWRNMRQLKISDEEASAIAGTHDTTDMPDHDHDMWALLLDMSERLRRVQEIVNAPVTVNLEEPGGDDGDLPAWNIQKASENSLTHISSRSFTSLMAAASA
jgi:hypothetical protein